MERFQRLRGLTCKTRVPVLTPVESQIHFQLTNVYFVYENNISYWVTGKNPLTMKAMIEAKTEILALIDALIAPIAKGESRLSRFAAAAIKTKFVSAIGAIYVCKARIQKAIEQTPGMAITPDRDAVRWCLYEALAILVQQAQVDEVAKQCLAVHMSDIAALDVFANMENPDGRDTTDEAPSDGRRMYS